MKALLSNVLIIIGRRIPFSALAVFSAIIALTLGWPHPAMAQMTLGDMMCTAFDNFDPFIDLMDGIAYVAGALLIGSGLLHLKGHAENQQNHALHQALARIIGGAALLGLPYFASLLINTLFLTPTGSGGSACFPGGVAPANGTGGLDVLVTNFVGNIEGPFISLVSGAAIVMGVLFIIRGLMKGAKYGADPRANSVPHIVAYLGIGTILIVVGQTCGEVLGTVFGTDFVNPSSDVLSWRAVTDLNASTQFTDTIQAALTFFQLIGMLAFVRGWYIVKNAVEGAGQATMAQGFTHIIGGVLAINIYSFLEIMDATFGTNLLG